MARFADAHAIDSEVVDGNDIVAVSRAAKRLIGQARANHTPGFLEAVTYRWRGHVDWREDVDVGVNRSAADLARWKGRDPVRRLAEALINARHLSEASYETLQRRIRAEVKAAWQASQKAPPPPQSAILAHVYARGAKP